MQTLTNLYRVSHHELQSAPAEFSMRGERFERYPSDHRSKKGGFDVKRHRPTTVASGELFPLVGPL